MLLSPSPSSPSACLPLSTARQHASSAFHRNSPLPVFLFLPPSFHPLSLSLEKKRVGNDVLWKGAGAPVEANEMLVKQRGGAIDILSK